MGITRLFAISSHFSATMRPSLRASAAASCRTTLAAIFVKALLFTGWLVSAIPTTCLISYPRSVRLALLTIHSATPVVAGSPHHLWHAHIERRHVQHQGSHGFQADCLWTVTAWPLPQSWERLTRETGHLGIRTFWHKSGRQQAVHYDR